MKKNSSPKSNVLAELIKRKMEAQKAGETSSDSFNKFKPSKPRNTNNSNVGPSWGPRKGN